MEKSENQDSIQVSKSSVGYGFICKCYKQDNEKYQDIIEKLKKIFNQLEIEFPNEVKK